MRGLWIGVVAVGLIGVLLEAKGETKKPSISLPTLRYSRDIQPLLSNKCFRCHGADAKARMANLRLDTLEGATKVTNGQSAIVPNKPERSRAYLRMIEKNPALRMPPPASHLSLTATEIEKLRRWIAQGAKYEKHWAFVPPTTPPIPAVSNRKWLRNPIDAFVLAELDKQNLKPAPSASKETLLRRLSLDLTGLPPTLSELDSFLKDTSPNAYEKVVERLLASPRYGEHMVMEWLDVARYADTNGYQEDRSRPMWFWRDWVVNALNSNMPFDRFTLEQIAGDLLPNSTTSQKIATGFHRNHMLNGEGGRIPEESRVDYVMDRVETTATTWLGLTLGCARCHDHKYDPFTMKDYYRLSAYYNSITETGAVDHDGSANPVLPLPSNEQSLKQKELQQALSEAENQLQALAKAGEAKRTEREQAQKRRDGIQASLNDLNRAIPVAMIMEERKEPRETFVLLRGDYEKHGERVERGVPEALPPLPKSAPPTRLGLAQWLVSPNNPLTSRVAVNRLWQRFFGIGIVKTAEDFGIQGERPSHPDLLDWLATEFVRSGWDVKQMIRLIVNSATYRQTSKASPALIERDPENRLLARGTRYRLPSYALRDQALMLSGLLVEKLGGAPVKPYQPEGVWEDFSYGKITYQQDHGDDLYRRSLYTFWRRSVAPTSLFDIATRRVCTLRVTRTNTPLQALILLNDVTFMEASRVFAERVLREGGKTAQERVTYAFRLATSRAPRPNELQILLRNLKRSQAFYSTHKEEATKLLQVGEKKPEPALDPVEVASFASVMSLILNLDEVISKE